MARGRRGPPRRSRSSKRSKLAVGLVVILTVIAAAIFAAGSWVVSVAQNARCGHLTKPQSSIVYAGDGSRLGYIQSDTARQVVPRSKIPKSLQYATVAIEDQRFFQHGGVDPEGIMRAAVKDVEAGKAVQGGSTITQQLVRNLCIADPKRDLERKIKEAKLAIDYADHHSKWFILGQYLNTASYGTIEGRTAAGVQAASKTYFSKPVWK